MHLGHGDMKGIFVRPCSFIPLPPGMNVVFIFSLPVLVINCRCHSRSRGQKSRMTGDTRETTIEAIASHGMSVLVKPFLGDELIQLINRLYRGSESSGQNRRARMVGQRQSMP